MISEKHSFLTEYERKNSDAFNENGFLISNSNEEYSDLIIKKIETVVANKCVNPPKKNTELNNIHTLVDIPSSNKFRLDIISEINSDSDFRKIYYRAAKKQLDAIVGNDLVMQTRINLSIQIPNDDSALLPVHADSWSGDSPFEVVLWVPVVDCSESRSMYILPATEYDFKEFEEFRRVGMNSDQIFKEIRDRVVFLDVNVGKNLIFNQNLPHGNILNSTDKTRWSLNCGFKSILSPFEDKGLGEFFEPINMKPMTRIGISEYKRLKGN